MNDELKALREFAKAIDACTVFELGMTRGRDPAFGESIAEIRCDVMDSDDPDERKKMRRVQKARDRLVQVGLLEAVK